MEDLQPEISIIIPIHQAGQLIADTCESLISQQGVRWEAIFIDAGEVLQASEIITSYQDKRLRVQALTKASLYALMNRGLLMAQGEYVNLLLEGCAYLSPTALAIAMKSIREQNEPDIFYTASYVGDGKGGEHLYYSEQWAEDLKKGYQPSLLQSCFFKTSIFKKIGYFDQGLDRRGMFDFICRATEVKSIVLASEKRVFVEMHLFPKGLLSSGTIFKETLFVIYRHFGIFTALGWLFSRQQKALFGRRYPLDFIIREI